MPRFKYTALNARGQETEGLIDAENQTSALNSIREKGLFPTNVAEASESGKKGKATAGGNKSALKMEIRMPAFLIRVKGKDLMNTTRQLATLVNAGLPLLRGLQVLQRQEKNTNLKRALNEMGEAIQSGSTFAEALAQHPRIFNRLFVNMARAGEVGGVLDQVLDRLAEFMEKAHAIRSKVISAMVYPAVVLFMAFAIVTFLLIFIIPKFEEIFSELLEGKPLPALTEMVMNVSTALTTRLPLVIGVIVGLVILIKLLAKTKMGGYWIDWFKLYVPVTGNLTRKTGVARFSRTLGTLMTSGVPVLQALNIVRDTAGNEVIAKAVNDVHDAVKEGENMAPPIEACGVFPPVVVSMIEVGEETGGLPEMLTKVADNYEEEVDRAVEAMTSIIEPLLIVFLAVIVGTIVIALFLPLVSIIGELS